MRHQTSSYNAMMGIVTTCIMVAYHSSHYVAFACSLPMQNAMASVLWHRQERNEFTCNVPLKQTNRASSSLVQQAFCLFQQGLVQQIWVP